MIIFISGLFIGIMVRVFANSPGDRGSISYRVMPKTQKWYLIPPCLTRSIRRYGIRIKWRNTGKGVAPSPTPWCSSYRKGSLRVALDYGRRLTYCNIWWCVLKVNVEYTVWRRISNTYENIANMSTGCGVHGDGYKDLMGEDGIYGASCVLWGYLWRGVGDF